MPKPKNNFRFRALLRRPVGNVGGDREAGRGWMDSRPVTSSPRREKPSPSLAGRDREISGLNIHLTAKQLQIVRSRRRQLAAYRRLQSKGWTQIKAAKAVGASVPTLWRYRHRLVPNTHLCGRHSVMDKLNAPAWMIDQIRAICATGLGVLTAWKAVVQQKRAPLPLRRYVRRAVTLPPCFYKIARQRAGKGTWK